MDSTSLLAVKLCNKRTLRIGEPCTGEHVTSPQSFRRYTLIILLVHSSELAAYFYDVDADSFGTAIFSISLKVAVAPSIFMKKFYNGRFAPKFSVTTLKEN